jgi:hypothetical protein
MDNTICYARTELGRDELKTPTLNLKPRCKQLLLLLNGSISVGTLKQSLNTFIDVESTLNDMLNAGLIYSIENSHQKPIIQKTTIKATTIQHHDHLTDQIQHANNNDVTGLIPLNNAKNHAINIIIELLGKKSKHIDNILATHDIPSFLNEVAQCKKILSAVASPSKGKLFESSTIEKLKK